MPVECHIHCNGLTVLLTGQNLFLSTERRLLLQLVDKM